MATITMTHLPEVTAELALPRSIHVATSPGRALGEVGETDQHYRRLLACLDKGLSLERGGSERVE